MIPITCTCGKSLKLKPEYAGKKVRCPSCQAIIKAPEFSAVDSTEEAAKGDSITEKTTAAIQGIGSSLAGMWTKKKADSTSDAPKATTTESILVPTKKRSVFEHLTAQKQDPAIIDKVAERVTAILSSNEELLYIAIQQRPLVNWFPDCVVLTSRRVITYHPKLLGRVDMSDYIWRKVQNARLQENMVGSTLIFDITNGETVSIDYLPKEQARELYRFAQEQEESATEERRLRRMEEDRAKAGGVHIMQQIGTHGTSPNTTPAADPIQKLQQLKQLLEAGLLTQVEYDLKRADVVKLL